MTDPLTEAERGRVDLARSQSHDAALIEIIDRLSAAPRAEREALGRARKALDLASERIATCGHEPGCSGEWPPHRCKCRLAEDLAEIRAARDALAAPAEED